MNHLLRERAPISDEGWEAVDDEAKQRLTPALAVRQLVDFAGPHGWDYSSTDLGRTTALDTAPAEGVSGLRRRSLPVVELRADFQVAVSELRDIDRGAGDPDFGALDAAARQLAVSENIAVFDGWKDAVKGIREATTQEPISLGAAADSYPRAVSSAVERLLDSGVGGPYGLALGGEAYLVVIQTTEGGGYRLLEHLRKIVEGPIVWTPGISGGVVLSQRGGDFVFESGQDVSVGYKAHDADHVDLYLEESFTFRVTTPEAAVSLLAS